MPKTKFGVGNNVSTDSGFAPYEGPLPKPGVVYDVEQKQAALKRAKSGTIYINSLWEVTKGECKGFSTWHRVVPGDHEIQQARVAQYMQACTGKNSADIVFEAEPGGDEEVGKITKIGTRKPQGVKSRASFQRKKDTYNVAEGEEAPWTAEISDLIIGGSPKPDDVEDAEEEEEEEEEEDLPDDDEVEDEEDEEGDEESDDEDESEEDDEESEEDEAVSYQDALQMSLADLKKLATEWESELDLAKYKGPKGKKSLLAALVDEEIVEPEDEEPPF